MLRCKDLGKRGRKFFLHHQLEVWLKLENRIKGLLHYFSIRWLIRNPNPEDWSPRFIWPLVKRETEEDLDFEFTIDIDTLSLATIQSRPPPNVVLLYKYHRSRNLVRGHAWAKKRAVKWHLKGTEAYKVPLTQ